MTKHHTGVDYFTFLHRVHQFLRPRTYLEIGTSTGSSLNYSNCDTICVDPLFKITGNAAGSRKRTMMFQMGSDDFFAAYRVRDYFPAGVDLSFLDGMHLFEFLLRDLINTEQCCHPRSLILMHDCLPMNERMAERKARYDPEEDLATAGCWTGDVWRVLPILKKYRPELQVRYFNAGPTGIVAVSNLDPDSTILSDNYHAILAEFSEVTIEAFGLDAVWNLFPTIDTTPIILEDDMTAHLSIW